MSRKGGGGESVTVNNGTSHVDASIESRQHFMFTLIGRGSVTVNNIAPHIDVNTERWECYSVVDHTFHVHVKRRRGWGMGVGGGVSHAPQVDVSADKRGVLRLKP